MLDQRLLIVVPLLTLASVLPLAGCGDDSQGTAPADDGTSTGSLTTSSGSGGSVGSEGPSSTGAVDETGAVDPDFDAARMVFEPLVRAQCEQAFGCCDADERFVRIGAGVTDADDCTTRMLDLMQAGIAPPNFGLNNVYLSNFLPFFAFGLGEGTVQVNDDGIAACVAEIEATGCPQSVSGDHCTPPQAADAQACDLQNLFTGMQQEGDSCSLYQNIECAEGLRCSVYGSGVGYCIEGLTEGSSCFYDYNCDAGLLCDYGSQTCVVPAASGESCSYADPDAPQLGTEAVRCAQGLQCNPLSGECESEVCTFGTYCSDEDDAFCPDGLLCVRGQCGLAADDGELCWEDDDCAVGRCAYNGQNTVCESPGSEGDGCQNHTDCTSGYCGPSNTCAATIANGQACDDAQPPQQCDGGYCLASECTAFAGVGQACDVEPCDYTEGVECIEEVCVASPYANGTPCSYPEQCESLFCEGTCAERRDVGSSCDPGAGQCVETAYCDAEAGECTARLSEGAPCSDHADCWQECAPAQGELRCRGTAPGQRVCDGT